MSIINVFDPSNDSYSQGSKLVANKLGKNMFVFAEEFSYSQGNTNVLLSEVIIVASKLFPWAIKYHMIFLFVWNALFYQNNTNRQNVVLIDRQNTGIFLDAVKITATKIVCNQVLV